MPISLIKTKYSSAFRFLTISIRVIMHQSHVCFPKHFYHIKYDYKIKKNKFSKSQCHNKTTAPLANIATAIELKPKKIYK